MKKKTARKVELVKVKIPKGFWPKYFEIVGNTLEVYMVETKDQKPMKFTY